MLFWLFVIVMVVGILLLVLDDHFLFDNDLVINTGLTMAFSGFLAVLASIIIISFSCVGLDAKVERYNTRYESLVYQYENDIYDNDNDVGKKELMDDIQEWNEDISYYKEMQYDFWLGIYYPNIYDQFEKIELKQKGEIKMETGTKETLCSKCLHLWVCKYKEELLEITSKADAIFDGSRFGYVLKCPEYIENVTIWSR